MIEGGRVLGVVPARGGSKGVPRKNVRIVGGRPLIAWTLEAASRSRCLDRTVVSTDNEEIAAVVRSLGGDVPFMRPEEISGDRSTHTEVILHALEQVPGYDYVVMLNPTAPLRTEDDIDGCITLCARTGAPAVVTVSKAEKPPEWIFRIDDEGRIRSVLGLDELPLLRQSVRDSFLLNGAVYVAESDWFRKTKTFFSSETRAYEMPAARSVDLDSELDFAVLEMILKERETGHYI